MGILDYIDPVVFVIALVIGLIYGHLTTSPPRIVIKYPTPFNAGKVTYVDDAGVCYKYRTRSVPCSSSARLVPIQESGSHVAKINVSEK